MIDHRIRKMILSALDLPPAERVEEGACVVLLHGLGRSSASMRILQYALEHRGYRAINHDYPSRQGTVEDLASAALPSALAACGGASRIHFVTHSMGGILLRAWAAKNPAPGSGRAVLLGPPNGGSEIVDRLGHLSAFEAINGPAGAQLRSCSRGLPRRLPGIPGREVGIIAGNVSLNPVYSAMIDGPNDGKVSVASAFAMDAREKLVLPVSHTWMTMNPRVISETIHFLEQGRFSAHARP